jgi:hypothetical protein
VDSAPATPKDLSITVSHTYALLILSPAAVHEIAAKLYAAGYQHAFDKGPEGLTIDMHGIGIQAERHELGAYACAVCCQSITQEFAWRCGCEGEVVIASDYEEGRPIPPSWVESCKEVSDERP